MQRMLEHFQASLLECFLCELIHKENQEFLGRRCQRLGHCLFEFVLDWERLDCELALDEGH